MSATSLVLRESLAQAATDDALDNLARNGKSFRFAGRFLGRARLRDCARLYRFCRYVDDIADEAPNPATARRRLHRISEELQSGVSADYRVADFLSLARQYDLDLRIAQQLIRGITADLEQVRFDSEATLKRYCYRVAGTVGLMMCAILGVSDERALPFAIDLGIAMQLTNIARDVAEDARADRRYVPADWLGTVEPAAVLRPNGLLKERLRDVTATLLHEAERYYRSAERGLAYLPTRERLAILVAARVYRAIGEVIARRRYATWEGRAVVSTTKKLNIACHVIGCFFVRADMHRATKRHDGTLHQHLRGLPYCNAVRVDKP